MVLIAMRQTVQTGLDLFGCTYLAHSVACTASFFQQLFTNMMLKSIFLAILIFILAFVQPVGYVASKPTCKFSEMNYSTVCLPCCDDMNLRIGHTSELF